MLASRAAAAALALSLLLVFARAGAPDPAAAAPRSEKPLPAFEGTTLDGRRLSIAELLGKRLLVLFVQPGAPDADAIVAAARTLSPARGASHFEIVVIAGGTDETALRALGTDFPVLRDPQGAYGAQLGLRGSSAALLVDADGYVVRGTELGGVPAQSMAGLAEGQFREWLRLPASADAGPDVEERPAAPAFVAQSLSGADKLDSASLRGKPAVLIFFLHTCPHCHHALEAMKGQLAALPEGKRPQLVAVSIVARQSDVEEALKEAKLDYFPVWTDGDEKIRAAYGALTGVPVIFGIDAAGRIQWRVDGWRDDRDPPLMKMRLAILAGEKAPMLLHSTGYSGDEFCATCHASQHDTWLTTKHAQAFDTLVRHGADRDAECVGCHVVGFGKPGGYDLAKPVAELEGVGCETCHGRGGPHLSPGAAPGGDYAATCLACHDPKHSLGFDYATFLPRVSHAANASLIGLSSAEREKRQAEQRAKREALLPTRAAYVGSEACSSCHASEHAKWAAHPHAKAFATLEHAGKAGNPECVSCHVTGYDKGGFPKTGTAAGHAAFLNVGCESCHGPGGDHVKADAAKKGTIVSLADKCDSCVILQVCGSCHDPENDPGFEYEVKDKIQAQRHSDRPLGTGASAEASR